MMIRLSGLESRLGPKSPEVLQSCLSHLRSACRVLSQKIGRDRGIRTPAPMKPIQLRYQTEPCPVRRKMASIAVRVESRDDFCNGLLGAASVPPVGIGNGRPSHSQEECKRIVQCQAPNRPDKSEDPR